LGSPLRCTDCEELVALDDSVSAGGARCIWRRCKKCHSTRKALRTWFSKAERLKDWEAMSTEERRKLIIQNKDKGAGKGHRRRVVVNEEVTCTDSLKLQSDKPFMTKKQLLSLQPYISLSIFMCHQLLRGSGPCLFVNRELFLATYC